MTPDGPGCGSGCFQSTSNSIECTSAFEEQIRYRVLGGVGLGATEGIESTKGDNGAELGKGI